MNKIRYEHEHNLAMNEGVTVEVSVDKPTGRGARDPRVLLNEMAYKLNEQPLSSFLRNRLSTYDTYMGMQKAPTLDWYAIVFPEPTIFNCVDMTMECAHRDGGWWTSLNIEVQYEQDGEWQQVAHYQMTPEYCFDNVAYGRRPYETFSLTFPDQTTFAVRLIGQSGGLACFTSLARLAVYHRDLRYWDASQLPPPPAPYIFRLIQPSVIWDLSESLVKLTGLAISVPTMDHYLDRARYERWWQRISRNYMGEPELWYLVGVSIGWDEYFRVGMEYEDYANSPREPYVRIAFHNTLACAVAPIIVDGQVLGEMSSHTVILSGAFDEKWHRRYAQEHGIDWGVYKAAVERSPKMTYEQIEGAAALMGMIANTITNLAHHNLNLKQELDGSHSGKTQRAKERQSIVQNAVAYMKENLEAEIDITDIARTVALSPTYFGIIFTEETGRSPIRYLNALRIERAKQYLTHTDMSVLDVSVALGYNPNYFARFFKRYTGLKVVNLAESAEYTQAVQLARSWYEKGYSTADPLPDGDMQAAHAAGKYESMLVPVRPGIEDLLKYNEYGGRDMVVYGISKPVMTTESVTQSMTGICANSKNPERSMMFIELLNNNQDLLNLLTLGIEGQHWVWKDKANNLIDFPEGKTAEEVFASYRAPEWAFGDVFKTAYRYESEIGSHEKMAELNASAVRSVALGLSLDFSAVQTEFAQVSAAAQQYGFPMEIGLVDPATGLTEYQQRLKEAGIDVLIAEAQRQVDAWAAAR